MYQKFLFLSMAGAAGTLSRYWLSGIVQKNISAEFPFGTAVVNILGCFVFGLLWAVTASRLSISPQMRIIIFVGFLGAFTTFSSFMFETSQLLQDSQWLWAVGNLVLQNFLGLIFIVAGLAV
ncbi:MAG: fluoride efflux transporter CrcB, partial [Sedimentisphaerales bacterium]|nr:fluoride efflux transporter CrcB [Sedimentisphaerales bacterium]